ncbi:MAG TPA: TIM barrel protein [Bryobacteraceae bacterium]|jgi:sugar phosphate isomerase/epimerase|nr:TIM barrel protein [Bryobacteraceae bacterium]
MNSRRQFLRTALSVSAAAAAAWAERAPIKIAHREGNMLKESSPGVYELGAKIGGISGIEVQTVRSKLWDREMALTYKKESARWNMRTVSMGGIMPAGGSLVKPETSEEPIRKAIASGEILGASVVLVPAFRQDCPKMDDEASYGPVVKLLQKLAPVARDAGIVLGLELSLSLDEHRKLMDLVADPNVRIYWDATGVDSMNHPGEGLKGIQTLGDLICQQHLKNNSKLMDEPGYIDWTKALPAVKASGYQGWMAFETPHATPEACIEQTRHNLAYVMKYLA